MTLRSAPDGDDHVDLDGRPDELCALATSTAVAAAELVRSRLGRGASLSTKSSPTDVVTQTDLDSEHLIRGRLSVATPSSGFVGEEGGATAARQRLQWVIDPLDGTVNFLYGLPVLAVSIAAAVDGRIVAGCVVDVVAAEVFSAALGDGATLDDAPISPSGSSDLSQSLVTTGFSYGADLRALQGEVISRLLPQARDIRCFGSAALQLCWVGCGRTDAYFERDTKVWDYAAASLIASEAGAVVELPCPENDGLVVAASPGVFAALRHVVEIPAGAAPD